MSKAVLISIRPEWCEKIINGKKTVEVRKTRPKMDTPFKCYIYCTKDGRGKLMVNARAEHPAITAGSANEREHRRNTMEKKILDVTCGSRTIWFNKTHPAAVYCDSRRESYTGIWKSTKNDSERQCVIAPDIQCDFTDLPFADDTFALVVFDPPHLERAGENSWMRKKYGVLSDNWPQMLHDGFHECMRVLKPDGVLIFKWSEVQIEAKKVWEAIGEKPLFGHRSGKQAKTFWGCFMKLGLQDAPEEGDKHE